MQKPIAKLFDGTAIAPGTGLNAAQKAYLERLVVGLPVFKRVVPVTGRQGDSAGKAIKIPLGVYGLHGVKLTGDFDKDRKRFMRADVSFMVGWAYVPLRVHDVPRKVSNAQATETVFAEALTRINQGKREGMVYASDLGMSVHIGYIHVAIPSEKETLANGK